MILNSTIDKLGDSLKRSNHLSASNFTLLIFSSLFLYQIVSETPHVILFQSHCYFLVLIRNSYGDDLLYYFNKTSELVRIVHQFFGTVVGDCWQFQQGNIVRHFEFNFCFVYFVNFLFQFLFSTLIFLCLVQCY